MPSNSLEERYRYYSLEEREREVLLSKVREVLERRGVELAVVFGSFLNGKEFRDVDVAVYSEGLDLEDLLKLGAELELELGVPVDLVPLDQLSPKFRLEVLRRGLVVVEKPGAYEHLYMRSQDELTLMSLSAEESRRGSSTPSNT
jgi:predicted nucleotidyltransferase